MHATIPLFSENGPYYPTLLPSLKPDTHSPMTTPLHPQTTGLYLLCRATSFWKVLAALSILFIGSTRQPASPPHFAWPTPPVPTAAAEAAAATLPSSCPSPHKIHRCASTVRRLTNKVPTAAIMGPQRQALRWAALLLRLGMWSKPIKALRTALPSNSCRPVLPRR